MSKSGASLLWILTAALAGPLCGQQQLQFQELRPLPGTPGLGGPLVGVVGERLVVAGGANFPNGPPWQGGGKVWHSEVFLLDAADAEWRQVGRLPARRAYGVAVPTSRGLLLAGGSDESRYHDECWLMTIGADGAPAFEPLPRLPRPSAFGAAAVDGDTVYVAAGSEESAALAIAASLWRLDLDAAPADRRWRECRPYPGPGRHKAVAAFQSDGRRGCFYLFSGEIPHRSQGGVTRYDYRRDAYRYDPVSDNWDRLGDLPAPMAAAPAAAIGQSHVLVFSGSTGEHVSDPDPRPEFPRLCRAYHTITDTWVEVGVLPRGLVTTQAVWWSDRLILPTGETSPGVRTPTITSVGVVAEATGMGLLDTVVLVLYLGALVVMGGRLFRSNQSADDFFLAGRRIPWWAAGISIFATQLSAITFLATPALAYATDWLVLPGKATILLMAPVVVLLYLPFFRRLSVTTAYEYLERRFGLSVRLFGSASFIAFQLIRLAVVIYLPALALGRLTGIDVYTCIAVMGVLATVYTVLGGMAAVIWTDVLQTVVLLFGILAAIAVALVDAGGLGSMVEAAEQHGKLRIWDGSLSATELVSWSMLLGTFALQFGPYTTDQAVIQRYMTTKDERAAARGIWLNGLMAIPVGVLFMALGTCLFVYFRSRPELLPVGMQNDEVFGLFVATELPAGLAGIVVAAIFAASMSSLDSSMHSIATAVSVDWYARLGRESRQESVLRFARWLTIGLGGLAVAAAWALVSFDIRSLWFFFQKCLGLVSSGLVGVFLLGIFTKRAHSGGVLLGVAASVAVLVYVTWFSRLHFYLYAVVGIAVCVVVGYVASRLLRAPARPLDGLTRWTGG